MPLAIFDDKIAKFYTFIWEVFPYCLLNSRKLISSKAQKDKDCKRFYKDQDFFKKICFIFFCVVFASQSPQGFSGKGGGSQWIA
jgi:TRAP-type mannitol/chloroaromatic compound transport system substrate-binding protein